MRAQGFPSPESFSQGVLVKISDIKPYPGNARHNEKAIPAVAESIREFGLRGQIVLESRENPVIVTGHTRVEAMKLLGWDEVPDEKIDFADDLTQDQIRAYRLADNKTGDIATWNKTLLQHEVRKVQGVDMSKYGFDFAGNAKAYGAERLRTDRAYNLDLVNIDDCGKDGMPRLSAVDCEPDHLIGFNYAKTSSDAQAGIHFFIDDYQFERVWSNPAAYIDLLRRFDCVLAPDFSLYMDMPYPMQRWNVYRSRALGHYWQREGLTVIPTLSWSTPESYGFAFAGLEPGGTYAVSTVGVKRSGDAMQVWRDGMECALRKLKPARILQYGGDVGFDFGGCEIVNYRNNVTERMAHHASKRVS